MVNIAIANDWSAKERRAYERYSVNFYIRVMDLASHTVLGNVADISLTGMRLVSATPIPAEKTFRVRMDIAIGQDDEEQVVFETTSVWTRADLNPGLYEIGFHNTLSPVAMQCVQRLIARIMSMEG